MNRRSAPHSWTMPVDVRFGEGAVTSLPSLVRGRQVIALLHAHAQDWHARLETMLGNVLLASFEVVDGLPTMRVARNLCESVWSAVESMENVTLLAFGGGATMDLAKAVRHRPSSRQFDSLAGWIAGTSPEPQWDPIDLVVVPTTAGTGSEVTRWATLWDTDITPPVKRSLASPLGFARAAVVDGECCLGCPDAVTRDSGLDALAHALEAIWNHHASPLSDVLSLGAARAVLQQLPRVLRDPQDVRARQAMSNAALQAGLAFSQTQTALAHALSYDLTLQLGLPHGLACAVWLPRTWALATGCDPGRDAVLAQVFGPGVDGPGALAAWLTTLQVQPLATCVKDADRRIERALQHPRGRNFIGAPHDAHV